MATRPALPVLWLAASLGLGALGARLPDAHGALPPAYGGTAVLPADGALVRPLPGDALTPLAAALESAVYDTLYTTDGNGRLVRIPPGVAHGCANLGNQKAQILYFVDVQVEGADNVPREGPVVFAANHPNSLMDTVLLGSQVECVV